MNAQVIKVGFCVAYDWELLKKSVPRVYDYADTICFSLDKNRTSWSGRHFNFDNAAFREWLQSVDRDQKVKVYEDNFYAPNLSAIENDNRQRTMMSGFMGKGGWHIQVDSDEYFIDFKGYRDYLLSIHPDPDGTEKPINVFVNVIPMLKKTSEGYIYVENGCNGYEEFPMATNVPEYLAARINSHFNHLSPYFILHETWARGEEDLWQKINSWGHDKDFQSKESFFNMWKALDGHNYMYIRDFHPLVPTTWKRLGYVPRTEIQDVVSWFKENDILKVTSGYLWRRNSRVFQKMKQLT